MSDDFKNLPTLASEFGDVRQIAYLVEDIEQAMKQWHSLFDVGPFLVARDATPLSNVYYRGERAPQPRVDIAFAYIDGMQLELIQQLDDTPSLYKEALDRNRSGVHHYAVCVNDFHMAYRYALDNGYAAVVDAGIDGLARMSYLENTEHDIILEMVEWNALTKPYFNGIETLAKSVDKRKLAHEFKLQQLMPVRAVLPKVGQFALNKLLGRIEKTRL